MQELFMEWMTNIAIFSIISSLFLKLLPGKNYLPYWRLMAGIILILLFLNPLLEFFHWEEKIEMDFLEKGERQLEELEKQYFEMLEEREVPE